MLLVPIWWRHSASFTWRLTQHRCNDVCIYIISYLYTTAQPNHTHTQRRYVHIDEANRKRKFSDKPRRQIPLFCLGHRFSDNLPRCKLWDAQYNGQIQWQMTNESFCQASAMNIPRRGSYQHSDSRHLSRQKTTLYMENVMLHNTTHPHYTSPPRDHIGPHSWTECDPKFNPGFHVVPKTWSRMWSRGPCRDYGTT